MRASLRVGEALATQAQALLGEDLVGIDATAEILDGARRVTLENRLRKESGDPRIHFAANCASRSCPPIARESYRGETLDQQLDRATRAFLASPGNVSVKEGSTWLGRPVLEVSVSRIFKWYARDFEPRGGVVEFLLQYSPPAISEAIRDAGERAKLRYQKYDWSLNSAQ